MTDPLRDPRFPNRPQSKDFWRLSDVVNELDGNATEGGKSLPEIMQGYIDMNAATYTATQRALRACRLLGLPTAAQPALAAIWLDAFMAGVLFERRGGHREE